MINNRQGGRRRGRGGQRPQGMPGGGGNRQDNRQRGNAAQLLEKYKSMARDAQLAGDRVQTEYYLQFADHYFRVLSESRVRFEEQRRGRDEDADDGSSADEPGFAHDEPEEAEFVEAEAETEGEDRPPRRRGRDRDARFERGQRRSNGAAREADEADERIAFDVLPPAIGADADVDNVEAIEEEPRPRRRARRPRGEDGETEIAPAA